MRWREPSLRGLAAAAATLALVTTGCGNSKDTAEPAGSAFGGTEQGREWSKAGPLTDNVTVGPADKALPTSLPGSKAFRYLGGEGEPAFQDNPKLRKVGKLIYRVAGASGPAGLSTYAVATTTRAQGITFRIVGGRNQAVRIRVDGHPGRSIRLTRPGYPQYDVTVRFPDEKKRTVMLETAGYNMQFLGATSTSYYTPLERPSDAQFGPRTIVLGDSWTEGSGVIDRFDDFPQVMGRRLGLWDVWASGLGGTGYAARFRIHNTTLPNFGQRLQKDVIRYEPSTVIVAGGGNDRKVSLTRFRTEVHSLFTRLHRELPRTRVIALGPWANSGARFKGDAKRAAIIRTEVRRAGGQFVSTAGWITGYGSTNHPRRDGGNADRYIGPTAHPTVAGHAYLGRRLANALEKLPEP